MKIEVTDLTFAYRKSPIINKLSFSGKTGDIIGIVGNNGSGKTTLLKTLGGFLIPTKGTVEVSDRINKDKPLFSGFFEAPRMWNNMTGRENLVYYSRNTYSVSKADYFFEEFKLKEYADEKVGNYSLGMRQKLALIISFMTEADILLFDEPTNSLDQESIDLFFKLASEYVKQGRIVILITHILYELNSYCNSVYLLKDGILRKWDTSFEDETSESIELVFETEDGAERARNCFKSNEIISWSSRKLVVVPVFDSVGRVVEKVCKYGIESVNKRKKTLKEIYMEAEKK